MTTVDRPPAPDHAVRRRIVTDTTTNVLLEAGAGSGKTTLLTSRIVALLAGGASVEHVAAVTFTRKAAGELRERVQARLEAALRGVRDPDDPWDPADPSVRERLERALHAIDRLFLGTVHAFCARLLRERPLDAGLDPSFEELEPIAASELVRDWYRRWLERLEAEDDARLREFERLGLDLHAMTDTFAAFTESPDVDWSAPLVPVPDPAPFLRRATAAVAATMSRAPAGADGSANGLWRLCQRLAFLQRATDWSRVADAFAAVQAVAEWDPDKGFGVKFWAGGLKQAQKDAVQDIREQWAGLAGEAASLLDQWLAHRYAQLAAFLHEAEHACREWRARLGRLTFTDLLSHAARLLREHDGARLALARRWQHLLVDEFQDTDPMQAEVMFRLAATPAAPAGAPWQTLPLRDGALFVVGDPKQSIYRFRRADIATWSVVQRRLADVGASLVLTSNFRSRAELVAFVNAHFSAAFRVPSAADVQVPYVPMAATKPGSATPAVLRHVVVPHSGSGGKGVVADVEASAIASWIAGECAAGRRTASAFLVLTRDRTQLDHYARAIAHAGLAVEVSGAASRLDRELLALQRVLELLADPTDPVRVVAVLEGPFIGATPADLHAAAAAGLRFTAAEVPVDLAAGAAPGAQVVHAALAQLHAWWQRATRVPVDALMAQVLDDTGLLALAAADPLGDSRAGLLLGLVDHVREAGRTRGLGLDAALEAVALALEDDAPEAALRPGRTDAVRVMNVHKAKGLEADVVVLAQPAVRRPRAATQHVRRDGDAARGRMIMCDDAGRAVARPDEWAMAEAAEDQAAAAEETRLEYVAATRARELLVIPALEGDRGTAQWTALAAASAEAPVLEIPAIVPTPLSVLDDATPIVAVATAAASRRTAALAPSWRQETVSRAAKGQVAPTDDDADGAPAAVVAAPHPRRDDGRAWGRVVHATLEVLGRGATDEAVRAAAHMAAAREVAADEVAGVAARAVALAHRVAATTEWAPIATAVRREFEWPLTWHDAARGALVEGIADVAVRDAAGHWTVIDWKTDRTLDAERRARYERQVAVYAEAIQAITGEPATGRIVWITPFEETRS